VKKTVASRIIRGLKEFSEALQNDESIADKFTCRKVTLALKTKAHDATSVKATRQLLKASQGVFAEFLGVRVSTLQSWEQGRQSPPGIACRFLDEIHQDPSYWRKRLGTLVRSKDAG